jgi:diketogulonate reductase-like aldo/keto reductase
MTPAQPHPRAATVRTVQLPSGEPIPVLGQGTWRMGEDPRRRGQEIAALRLGLELGLTLIDTAEMYADGLAEELTGEALAGRRDSVFLVSKVRPLNATRRGTVVACENSLRRLRTDRLDLYLLHWRGRVPLAETIAGFNDLRVAGRIRHWGVSNFDLADMEELVRTPGGVGVQANQVLYNLASRGVECDLLPWCLDRGLAVMAHSPILQGRLLSHPLLGSLAARLDATPAQVALAWVLRVSGVNAIVKAANPEHVRENRAALELHLSDRELDLLSRAFPPASGPRSLADL